MTNETTGIKKNIHENIEMLDAKAYKRGYEAGFNAGMVEGMERCWQKVKSLSYGTSANIFLKSRDQDYSWKETEQLYDEYLSVCNHEKIKVGAVVYNKAQSVYAIIMELNPNPETVNALAENGEIRLMYKDELEVMDGIDPFDIINRKRKED